MNIFYIEKTPKEIAKNLCDKHIVKMPLESAQMLCTAWWCTTSFQDTKLILKNSTSQFTWDTPQQCGQWKQKQTIFGIFHYSKKCLMSTPEGIIKSTNLVDY